MSQTEQTRDPAINAIGGRFGKYEVRSAIGSGGMATVYRASLRGPGRAARPVALKLIHPHLSEETRFVRMFLDEMRIAMAFTHRNIVQTFDAGKIDDRYYLTMELIDGCSLRAFLTHLPDDAVPLDIALFVGMELASALSYAHNYRPELTGQPAAVVHRDVSPSNILLARDGSVKLADFGVARAMDAMGHSSVGTVKGKLSYMAPEQARGSAERRSDIFAAGVVLYEMLSGEHFRPTATLEEVLTGPTQLKPLSLLEAGVPPAVDQLIQRCLSPDPAHRPACADTLHDELSDAYFKLGTKADARARLSRYLNGLPNLARPKEAPDSELAQAILAEVQDVPTLRQQDESSVVDGASPTVKMHRRAPGQTTPGQTTSGSGSPPPSGRRGRTAVLVTVVLLLGVSVWLLHQVADQDDDAAPREHSAPVSLATSVDASANTSVDLAATPQAPDAAATAPDAAARAVQTAPLHPTRQTKRRTPSGRLILNSLPWSKVFVDGRYRGDTPLEGLELPTGRHRVRLVSPQRGLSRTFTIRIRSGAVVRKVIDLTEPQ